VDRRRREAGFTLVELLVVMVVIGALLAIAIPSYLGHRERAEEVGAKALVRQALPAMEAYFNDHGTYVGATPAVLRAAYDAGLSATLVTDDLTATGYCAQATLGTATWSLEHATGTWAESAC
jgi:type IV pilus assembly protein PilA